MNLMKKEQKDRQVENTRGNSFRTPACDIHENENSYLMIFDLPGVEKKDVNITVEQNVLNLSAESSKAPGEGYDMLREEMQFSGYKRSFELGETVDSGNISAEYDNGSLTVTLPKKENQKTKKIQIELK